LQSVVCGTYMSPKVDPRGCCGGGAGSPPQAALFFVGERCERRRIARATLRRAAPRRQGATYSKQNMDLRILWRSVGADRPLPIKLSRTGCGTEAARKQSATTLDESDVRHVRGTHKKKGKPRYLKDTSGIKKTVV
jgi:hypothetical protein